MKTNAIGATSDTLLLKKGFRALEVVSPSEIEHSESANMMTPDGCMLDSGGVHTFLLIVDLAIILLVDC